MKLDCPEMIDKEVLKIKAKKLNLFYYEYYINAQIKKLIWALYDTLSS